jgi:hypothetical protein
VVVEDRQDVGLVLRVQLDDLHLGQQQLGERHGRCVELDPLGDRDRVAHLERADEDVHLTAVGRVVVEQPAVAVRGVEGPVGLVAHPGHELGYALAAALERDEVDVLVGAGDDRLAADVHPHGQAADQADGDVRGDRRLEQAIGLQDDVVERGVI